MRPPGPPEKLWGGAHGSLGAHGHVGRSQCSLGQGLGCCARCTTSDRAARLGLSRSGPGGCGHRDRSLSVNSTLPALKAASTARLCSQKHHVPQASPSRRGSHGCLGIPNSSHAPTCGPSHPARASKPPLLGEQSGTRPGITHVVWTHGPTTGLWSKTQVQSHVCLCVRAEGAPSSRGGEGGPLNAQRHREPGDGQSGHVTHSQPGHPATHRTETTRETHKCSTGDGMWRISPKRR